MQIKDSAFYRAKAEECRNVAARAKDLEAKREWQQAQACWLELAHWVERHHGLPGGPCGHTKQ
jgi:hypothetical protein